MSRGWIAGCMLVMAVASSPASALSFEDVRGTWCGSRSNLHWTNYTFTRDTLTVTYPKTKERKVFDVDDFEFQDASVIVTYWGSKRANKGGTPGSDKKFNVTFDMVGSRLYQRSSSAGGTYEFHRC
jgi:hypothetical protein